MITELSSHDLARVLGALREAPSVGSERVTLLASSIEMVSVAPGERWDATLEPADRVLVVMSGVATIVVDDWRATAGPGLAIGVPAKKKVAAIADGDVRVELLVFGSVPEPEALPEPEPEPERVDPPAPEPS